MKRLHAFMAAAFLCVMLVELGSHSLAFAHAAPISGLVSILNIEVEHDDPCRTIACCESRREQKAPNFQHDLFPYGSTIEPSIKAISVAGINKEPAILRETASRISRPKDPLLHPPEFSEFSV